METHHNQTPHAAEEFCMEPQTPHGVKSSEDELNSSENSTPLSDGTPRSEDYGGTPRSEEYDWSPSFIRRTPTRAPEHPPPRKPQARADVSCKEQNLSKGGVVKNQRALSAEKAKKLSKFRQSRGRDTEWSVSPVLVPCPLTPMAMWKNSAYTLIFIIFNLFNNNLVFLYMKKLSSMNQLKVEFYEPTLKSWVLWTNFISVEFYEPTLKSWIFIIVWIF